MKIENLVASVQNWRNGVRRITERDVERLVRIKSKAKLLEAIPSKLDKPQLSAVSNFLLPVYSLLASRKFKATLGFEIWSYQNSISFYLLSNDSRALDQVKSQLNAVHRNAIFREPELRFLPIEPTYVAGAWVYLDYYLFHTKTLDAFSYDPLSHILEAMQCDAVLQLVFKAHKLSKKQAKMLENATISNDVEEEIVGKLTSPFFKVLIRAVAFSQDPNKARQVVEQIANAFAVFNGSYAVFRPLVISHPILSSSLSLLRKMVQRKFPRFYSLELRKTFLLSLPELATIFHLPTDVEAYTVKFTSAKQLSLPTKEEASHELQIGFVKFRGKPIEKAGIQLQDLTRHVYVLGASGTGKSSLLINLIAQAQQRRVCVHVIDPHGDLAYDAAECLGPEKLENIIFLDPLKVRFSINPFELPKYSDQYEREILIERIIGQMVEMMKRIFGERYWGPSLNRTFQNIIRLLYHKDDSPTFEDILNVLQGRIEKLGSLATSESLKEFLAELRKIPHERLDAVINKVDPFVKNALLRMLFCNKTSSVDFSELLQQGKVVLWRLAKAELTEQNMQMIGSAIITKLWFNVGSREREQRAPILLFIDEFQNFAYLETLTIMITEGRKFGIGLVLTHQHTKQLPEEVLSEVLGNTATKIIFRVSGEDATALAKNLDVRMERNLASVLTNLPDGSAVVKLRAGFGHEPIEPFEIFTLNPLEKHAVDFDKLLEDMKQRFGSPTPSPVRIQPQPQTEGDEEMLDILEAVDALGSMGVAGLSKLLGIRADKLKQKLDKAEQKGLLHFVERRTKGRPKLMPVVSIEVIQNLSEYKGREGSLLHRKAAERLAEYFRGIGYRSGLVLQGGTAGQCDLVAEGFGQRIAVEIESRADHPEQVRRNYEKNIGKFDRIIFVGIGREVVQRIRRIVPEAEVYDFFDFFKEDESE